MNFKIFLICQLIAFVRTALITRNEEKKNQQPEITIPELGKVQGKLGKSYSSKRPIYEFFGINYAKSPSGKRRFQPPEPYEPWQNVYDATKMRQRCPQMDTAYYPSPDPNQLDIKDDIEDCLVVNVFTPSISNSKDSLYPVLFYIHGGSFYLGSAYDFLPDFLLDEDIILVVPQYRLGPLGFLSLHTEEIPGNAGMLDIILALEWVKKYIQYFNGDSESVTVVGQSAGAAAASSLLVTPLIKQEDNLFHKMIIESGSILGTWAIDNEPVQPALMMAKILGCPVNDLKACADCLTQKDPMDMVKAHGKYVSIDVANGGRGRGGSCLVIQKAGSQQFLTEYPQVLFAKGNFIKVPIIGGITRDEGTSFFANIYDSLALANVTDRDYFQRNLTKDTLKFCGYQDLTGALTDFFHNTYFLNQPTQSLNELSAGLIDICGVLLLKASTYQTVRSLSYHVDSFAYSFNFYGSISKLRASDPLWDEEYPFPAGVAHSDELGYLFPSVNSTYSERELKMVKTMVSLWTNFVKTGIPAPGFGVSEWPPMTNEFGPYLRISDESEVRRNIYDEYMIATKEGFEVSSVAKLSSSYYLNYYFPVFSLIQSIYHVLRINY